MIYKGLGVVFIVAIVGLISQSSAQDKADTLFQIGQPDVSSGEFGYGKQDYRSFPAQYKKPIIYSVGKNKPRDWPFIHPAHRDKWAGSKAYTYTIRYNSPLQWKQPLYLILGLADAHQTERSIVTVSVNGKNLPTQTAPAGTTQLAHTPRATGQTAAMTFTIPAGQIKKGQNDLTIRLDKQSWIIYDYITLRTINKTLPIIKPTWMNKFPSDLKEIVYAERSTNYDGHWYANLGYYADSAQRKAYGARGRLCKLNLKTKKVTVLVDAPKGAVRDPVVHYDGKTIVFSYRKDDKDQYHLYEIQSDGTGLKQLTFGKYDDIEPCWMPDDSLMFISTRCKRWVNCWLTQVAVLYRCDRDGQNIRQVSANIEHDNTPWPLHDGRVLYQRWEYVDRSQVHYHHLWTTNPDGTGQTVYYGNMHPGIVMIDAKSIPGTDKVVSIFSPGHGAKEHAGAITVVSPRRGPDDQGSAKRISRAQNFRDPWAFNENLFLAAQGQQLVWVNGQGRTSVLYRLPSDRIRQKVWVHEPRPLIARKRELVIPARTNLKTGVGQVYLADVNIGRNMKDVKQGQIKKLLIMESLPKPINYTGGMEPLSYGGTFTLPRILGTVPVEADGSAYMELPAMRSLFFIALDKNDNAVKRMQSFMTVMPGEVTGCVGCHEHRTTAPSMNTKKQSFKAFKRSPSQIKKIEGIPDVYDFPRDIQPILDRHCVKCHDYKKRKGYVILTGDRGPMYSHSYYMLTTLKQFVDGRNNPVSNLKPYAIGASASPLMKKITGKHHKVKLSEKEIRVIRYWIESGAPYPGTYAALGSGMIGGYHENKQVNTDWQWPQTKTAGQAIKQRCDSCHKGQRVLPHSLSDERGISFWRPDWKDKRLKLGRHILFNLSRPDQSLMLLAPLSKKAGGYGSCKQIKPDGKYGKPIQVFADTNDPNYKKIRGMIQTGHHYLNKVKRFDMPDFKPPQQYVREMKRYGILPPDFDLDKDPIDVYQTDRAYWELLGWKPEEE